MLKTIIMLVILTKGLVIATDQCTEYQFRSHGESCEDIYNKYPESHKCSGYYWIAHKVFCGMSYTGLSCEDIFKRYPEIYKYIPNPGYYHLSDKTWTYCNMTKIAVDGGFTSAYTLLVKQLNLLINLFCLGTRVKVFITMM